MAYQRNARSADFAQFSIEHLNSMRRPLTARSKNLKSCYLNRSCWTPGFLKFTWKRRRWLRVDITDLQRELKFTRCDRPYRKAYTREALGSRTEAMRSGPLTVTCVAEAMQLLLSFISGTTIVSSEHASKKNVPLGRSRAHGDGDGAAGGCCGGSEGTERLPVRR